MSDQENLIPIPLFQLGGFQICSLCSSEPPTKEEQPSPPQSKKLINIASFRKNKYSPVPAKMF